MIYLDYNATTPLADQAAKAMQPYLGRRFGNPSSIHLPGREARAAVDQSRDRLAAGLGVQPHELVFTGSGTEADNLAVLGLARANANRGRHLLTSTAEHHAVLKVFEHLRDREGFEVDFLPVDGAGRVDPGDLERAITGETTLVSIMSANNETGVLQPLEEISGVCRAHGVLLHSDMVQSFGKEPVRLDLVDASSFAAHKFYGPKGVGLLYLRAGASLEAVLCGGSQENGRRPGTENVAGIVGMAAAAEFAGDGMREEARRETVLRDRLKDLIFSLHPESSVNGHPDLRLSNTLNISVTGLDGEALLINLDLDGICASSGSACMTGSPQPSHVLRAMGLSPEHAEAAVRFSLGRFTTNDEIEETGLRLKRVFGRMR